MVFNDLKLNFIPLNVMLIYFKQKRRFVAHLLNQLDMIPGWNNPNILRASLFSFETYKKLFSKQI